MRLCSYFMLFMSHFNKIFYRNFYANLLSYDRFFVKVILSELLDMFSAFIVSLVGIRWLNICDFC